MTYSNTKKKNNVDFSFVHVYNWIYPQMKSERRRL